MEKEAKIKSILCIAMNTELPANAPVFNASFVGLSPAGEILVSGLSPTNETFAPIPNSIVIKCPLSEKDKAEIAEIKLGVDNNKIKLS